MGNPQHAARLAAARSGKLPAIGNHLFDIAQEGEHLVVGILVIASLRIAVAWHCLRPVAQ